MLDYICNCELMFAPGEEKYSDLGFQMLGFLVERITGRSMDEYVKNEIYKPLGLKRTTYLRWPTALPPRMWRPPPSATRMSMPWWTRSTTRLWLRLYRRSGRVPHLHRLAQLHPAGRVQRRQCMDGKRRRGRSRGPVLRRGRSGRAVPGHAERRHLQGVRLYKKEVIDEFTSEQNGKPSRGLGFERGSSFMGRGDRHYDAFGHAGFTGTHVS